MYLNFNSLKCVVWDKSMKKSFSHFKNYILIPFSVQWHRRAATTPGRLLQKITTTIPHSVHKRQSLDWPPVQHATPHLVKHISFSDIWDGLSLESCCEHCIFACIGTKREKTFFMPAWIRQLFSPFLLLRKSRSERYFCCEGFKDAKVPWSD